MNDNIVGMAEHNRIREEASLWLARLDGEGMDQQAQQEFEVWLEADNSHRKLFRELAEVWGTMDTLALFYPILCPEESQPVQSTTNHHKTIHSRVSHNKKWFGLAAAALLLVAVTLTLSSNWQSPIPADIYTTAIGEQQQVTLDDGSSVHLNTNSIVEVSYSKHKRLLRLVRGEAYFDVAHNKQRPFIVQAGKGSVEAVGTAFSVQLQHAGVKVQVTDGRIKVSSAEKSPTQDAVLGFASVGQTVIYEKDIQSITTSDPDTLNRQLSWRNGILRFEGESLGEVIRQVSRYSRDVIVITDPDLNDIRIGGVFKTGDTETLLSVLDEGFQLSARRVGEHHYYLQPR